MTNPSGGAAYPTLSLVVLSRRMTSYAFRQTLDSLRQQTHVNLELLAVDCNQSGDAWSIGLQEDLSHQRDVRLLTPAAGCTLAEACNQALHLVNGEYIGFVDSSDLWQEDKAERQIALLAASPQSSACCCSGYRSDGGRHGVDHRMIFRVPREDPRDWLISDQFALASQLIYRREALLAIGGFDPALQVMLHPEALYRLSGQDTVLFLPEALFDNAAPPVSDDPDPLYRDMVRLLYRHDDLFLRSKRRYQAYCFRLACQAARCKLWIQMVMHGAVSFCKAPFAACGIFLRSLARRLGRMALLTLRQMQLRYQSGKLQRSLRTLRKGQGDAAPSPAMPATEGLTLTVDPALHDRAMQFMNRADLHHVIIPDHMTVIRQGMFAFCRNLQSVQIPATVERIEAHAFHGCERLHSVTFQPGSQLTSLGAYAFAGCTSLSGLVLSGMLSQAGPFAFAGCSRLGELRFAFRQNGAKVERPLFPASWTGVARGLFAGCRSLQTIHFPEEAQLAYVGEDAFAGCSSLHFVCVTGHVQQIGSHAFAGCTALTTFTMPYIDDVRTLGRGAFQYCESLAFFRLPMELLMVSRQCFEGCRGLRYIKIPKKVDYVDARAFALCPDLAQVILLSSATRCARDAFEPHTQIDRSH